MSNTKKSAINIRTTDSLKKNLEKMAQEDKRTLSAYIEIVLTDHVEKKLSTLKGQKVIQPVRNADSRIKKNQKRASEKEPGPVGLNRTGKRLKKEAQKAGLIFD